MNKLIHVINQLNNCLSWCRVIIEKLVVAQLVTKLADFYWPREFITVFTKPHHWIALKESRLWEFCCQLLVSYFIFRGSTAFKLIQMWYWLRLSDLSEFAALLHIEAIWLVAWSYIWLIGVKTTGHFHLRHKDKLPNAVFYHGVCQRVYEQRITQCPIFQADITGVFLVSGVYLICTNLIPLGQVRRIFQVFWQFNKVIQLEENTSYTRVTALISLLLKTGLRNASANETRV
jgi:hypothetical protein